MIALALVGIIFNGAGVLRLKKGASINERVLTWHLLEDVLGWVVGSYFKKTLKKKLGEHHIEHSTIELESERFCSGIECDRV